MSVYHFICFISSIAIIIAFLNNKISKKQSSIVITALSLLFSLTVILTGKLGWISFENITSHLIQEVDFKDFLLNGMLGFLLFAGGLNISLVTLKQQKWEITVLALFATLVSTFAIGYGLFFVCESVNVPLPLIYCLLFGALISPTDPIAVLAIVKKLNAPEQIAIQIEGESLFNDGFGLVIFVSLFTLAFGNTAPTFSGVLGLFAEEAIGGIVYGFVLGLLFNYLIKEAKGIAIKILMTLIIPTAGYVLASMIHVSGPLAMVVVGIFIGNVTLHKCFTEDEQKQLSNFWGLIEEYLNGILFLLIGLVIVTFNFHQEDWLLMLLAIPLVLAGRYISVNLSYFGFKCFRKYNPLSAHILVWGGLRGGLAIAMAMSIPAGVMILPEKTIDVRELILLMTYSVVLFSILIQGSSITSLIKKAKLYQA